MHRQAACLATIDGQPVNVGSLPDAIAKIVRKVQKAEPFTVFTLNLDHLVKRRTDGRFREAYARADLVTADGAPVVALSRKQGASLSRTTGADLVLPLCKAAAAERIPVFLFGSDQHVLECAADVLRERAPGLDVRGCLAPRHGFDPASMEADAFGTQIANSGARLCFVCLGAPKQELFSDRMAQRGFPVGWLCVGAALDFIAGEQKRAPAVFQKTGLEWTWRLLTNPRRMAARYARCAVLFAGLLLGGSDRPVVDQAGAA
ncbi:MAG TPA: WecB/TagA/CpsF family glycosyltransferase [Caulobacteraceae bacterium]|jgi:exopolysaccharide biosynthesis WecB/TagA/CpsF family protein